jgi:FkbM family methyltransferase
MKTAVDMLRPLSFRGKARLLDRFIPHQGSIDAQVFGYDLNLDLEDHIQRLIYIGAYERDLERVLRGWLKPGMTFLDVGANAGFFTLLAARLVGSAGRVISVEPSPWVAERLAATVARNGLANVTVARIALGNTTGTLPLPAPLPGNHSPSLLETAPDRPRSLVPVARLDDRLEEWVPRGGVIDAMKVDIEGYEPFLFEGAKEALSSGRIRRIATEASSEWLPKAGSTPEKLRSQLTAFGFRQVGTLDAGSANETLLMEYGAD